MHRARSSSARCPSPPTTTTRIIHRTLLYPTGYATAQIAHTRCCCSVHRVFHCPPHTTLRASTLVGGRWRWRWPDGDGLMAVDDDGILGLVRGDDGPQSVSARTGSHTHTTVSRSCVDTPTHRRTLGTAAFASSTTQHNTTQHNTTQRDAALVISITAAAAAAVSLLLELMHEQWFAARKTCLLLVAVCPHTYRT